jgi:hypothetical protein
MGSKKQTIGYHYLMAMLSGLWRGPINGLTGIKVGDKMAWTGNVTDDSMQTINVPSLFGGEKKEGGIAGGFRVFMGAPDQVLPGAGAYTVSAPVKSGTLPDVQSAIGGLVSEFRGVVTFWFDGLITSMNPYPKAWKFRGWRTTAGWYNDDPWYPEKATIYLTGSQIVTLAQATASGWTAIIAQMLGLGTTIIKTGVIGGIKAMNPAHIIYECCTNPEWGRGLDRALLDENSFVYSANLFCSENFGLCMTWFRKEEIDVFIQTVLEHVGGALYTARETGLHPLRPIRLDYDPDNIPTFDEDSGLLDILDDDTASSDTAYSEVIITGHDPIEDKDFEMRAQNTAAWQESGAANTLAKTYKGLPTKELAGRVAARELKVHASGLKRFRVVLDRRAWRVAPASVFKIISTKRGIGTVILRAGEIEDTSITDGRITIRAVEDVFGMPETSFIEPVEGEWTPPATDAQPPTAELLTEAGYRDIYLVQGESEANAMTEGESVILQVAAAPSSTALEYDLWTKADGETAYDNRGSGHFTGTATLAADVGPLDTTFMLEDMADFDAANIGDGILIGNEMVGLVDIDTDTGEATVKRGGADTLPQAHSAGDRLWTVDDDATSDGRIYEEGELVYAKVLTKTSSDELTLDEATEQSVTVAGRAFKPFPPADLKVDGDSIFTLTGEHTEPVFTWAERNRLTQADVLYGHTEASIAGEVGQTVTFRIYNFSDDTLLRTETGITGTTWTYDATMQGADGGPTAVRVEMESDRDGVVSWQHYSFLVVLKSGWGYGWGLNWGGAG